MLTCEQCDNRMPDNAHFCNVCGTPLMVLAPAAPPNSWTASSYPGPYAQPAPVWVLPPSQERGLNPHHLAARGVAQTFGLHPAMAFLTIIVNTMAFAGGFVIPVGGWLLSIPVGIVISVIVYMGQKKWYDDDHESALIKALIVGFLTAIPTSLPGFLTIPAGIMGFFRKK